MFMFFMWLATTVIGELLRPKPKNNAPQPAGIGDVQVTTAEAGRPVPVAYGMPLLKGANCVWYGDLRSEAMTEEVKTGWFSSQTITKGYKYYMGSQLVFCRGFSPGSVAAGSGIKELRVDDKRFTAIDRFDGQYVQTELAGMLMAKYNNAHYFTTAMLPGDATKSFARIDILDNDLFGGDDNGGGFSGIVDFHFGQGGQDPNDYLQRVVAADIPAYRGFCYAVLRQCYIGTSQYPKMVSAVVRHYPWFWSNADIYRNINNDANPIAIVVDLMTNKDYGLGYEFSELDIDGSFYQAATQCYAEGLGMTLVYDTLASAGDLIEDVMRHIDGTTYIDPATGKFKIKLARADYIVGNLPVLDVDNITTLKLTRSSWGDTKNVVKVRYTNRDDNYKTGVVEVKNTANINVRGGLRDEETYDFLGLSNPEAATKVAARVLKTVSTPMARFTLTVNRDAVNLHRGAVFCLNWAPLGISNMACRVTSINYGDLTEPTIEIEACEDVWGMMTTQISAPQATSSWVDPVLVDVPNNVANRLWEVPHFLAGDESRRVVSLGTRSHGMVQGYSVQQLINGGYIQTASSVASTPSGTLSAAVAKALSAGETITVAMPLDSSLLSTVADEVWLTGNSLVLVDDELIAYKTVTQNADGTVTLGGLTRAVMDTVPAAHGVGARAWFITEGAGLVQADAYAADQTVTAQLIPFASRGAYAGSVAPVSVTTVSRAAKPLPPGCVRVNNQVAPASLAGDVTLSWAHRDKVAQLSSRALVGQDDTGGALPAGTTYTVVVLVGATAVRTVPDIAGNSFVYTNAMAVADGAVGASVTFELRAVKAGLSSTKQVTSAFTLTA